jgi:hypothetical protein
MKKLLLFLVILFFTHIAISQTKKYEWNDLGLFPVSENGGNITINQDEKLLSVLKSKIEANSSMNGFSGWRVQIFLGSGRQARDKANGVKAAFMKDFPDVDVYISYDAPYFRVRAGDFRTRQEAFKLKKTVESKYSTIWVVEDKINFPKL